MRRLLSALRWVESQPGGKPPGPLSGRTSHQPGPLYARITAHAADGYSWVQSLPKADGTWADLASGFVSTTSGKAFEVGGRTDIAVDTIVRLESRQTSDGLPIWAFTVGGGLPPGTTQNQMLYWDVAAAEWKLLAPPASAYMVLQRKSDGTLGWDWPRVHA
jgi:hypothetical protein